MPCVALLDDRAATPARPSSRLYEGFAHEHRCVVPWLLEAVWAQVDADLRAGLHALLLADYEWGTKLLRAGARPGDASALRVLMFRTLTRLSRDEVDAWLAAREPADAETPPVVRDQRPTVDRAAFTPALAAIPEALPPRVTAARARRPPRAPTTGGVSASAGSRAASQASTSSRDSRVSVRNISTRNAEAPPGLAPARRSFVPHS